MTAENRYNAPKQPGKLQLGVTRPPRGAALLTLPGTTALGGSGDTPPTRGAGPESTPAGLQMVCAELAP